MFKSDLFIGSAGTTNWERACLGLPSIVKSTISFLTNPSSKNSSFKDEYIIITIFLESSSLNFNSFIYAYKEKKSWVYSKRRCHVIN